MKCKYCNRPIKKLDRPEYFIGRKIHYVHTGVGTRITHDDKYTNTSPIPLNEIATPFNFNDYLKQLEQITN